MQVLIVEDFEPEAFLLASLIASLSSRVDIAHTMAEAWQWLRGQIKYDVVFFDLTLKDSIPQKSIEAVEEMKHLAKIVVVTGNPDPAMEQSAMAAGAHSYLLKHDPDFADKVRAHLVAIA